MLHPLKSAGNWVDLDWLIGELLAELLFSKWREDKEKRGVNTGGNERDVIG